MKKYLLPLLVIGVSCLGFYGAATPPQLMPQSNQFTVEDSTRTPKEYEKLIYSLKGPDLFRAHCAACHGQDAKGDGPVGATLKTRPADLTLLTKNSWGKFPEARVRRVISGDEPSLLSHGSREMPVWGPIFHQIEADQDFGNVRMQNLITYLQSIQQK